jgi:hypothetical protein
MLGTKHAQTGAVLVQGGTDPSADTPRTWPRAQRQPTPLRRAIPTPTGAVLVSTPHGRAAPCSAHRRLTLPERCRSADAAGLSMWLQS